MTRAGLFFIWGCFWVGVSASAVEYVSPQKVKELETSFAAAQPPKAEDLTRLNQKDLTCDMFGVRTRLQVERDVKLYNFKDNEGAWENRGAQMVRSYELKESALIGQNGSLLDQVRITKTKEILARLSLNGETVLAYSLCHTAKML